MLRHSAVAVLALALAHAGNAQSMTLDVKGGAYPGTLQLTPRGGGPGKRGVILLSVSRGPTPLRLIDPRDTRLLSIGSESLGVSFPGVFDLNGRFLPPVSVAVPADPGFQNAALFFQCLSLPGAPLVIDEVSNPAAVYFSRAGEFRDRGVRLGNARGFHLTNPAGGGRFLVTGGGQGALTNLRSYKTTEIFDPFTNTFTPGPPMTIPHGIHQAVTLTDGRTLVIAGIGSGSQPTAICEIYDPKTNAFRRVAPIPTQRFGHMAALLPDGKVLVAGGLSRLDLNNPLNTMLSALDDIRIYDPATDRWTLGGRLSTRRAAPGVFVRPDGKVMIAGGLGVRLFVFPTVHSSCDVFDPATGRVTAGPPMNDPRSIIFPTRMSNDRFLTVGGITSVSFTTPGVPTATAEYYDARANRWVRAGSISRARALIWPIAIAPGEYLAAGGAEGSLPNPTAVANADLYDERTNRWTRVRDMTITRAAATPILLPSGQAMFVGGATGTGSSITATNERYYR